mgnify:CR=1 FL=1
MSVLYKITLLLTILFVATIGNSVFSFMLLSNGEDKLQWVTHTNKVLYTSERFLASMIDSETGQRGYLLTSNSSYLEPYTTGKQQSAVLLRELKELTIDNPEQQKRLNYIEKKMKLKNDELALTVSLAEQNNLMDALKIVIKNDGMRYMDEIRAEVKKFVEIENKLLKQRTEALIETRSNIITSIYLESLFFLLFAIFTFVFIHNRLFSPMNLLLSNIAKFKNGERVDMPDKVPNDEMGLLLSSFYYMSKKVADRTQKLQHKAFHDELTGLKNRSMVFTEVENAIVESEFTGTIVGVFFLDLNDFKQVNDVLGHDIGDGVLKETAIRLSKSVRSNDGVYRIGGDEFILLFKNIDKESDIDDIAKHICSAFKLPMFINDQWVFVFPSIGISISPNDANTCEDLFRLADIAMYDAKKDESFMYKRFEKDMLDEGSGLTSKNGIDCYDTELKSP